MGGGSSQAPQVIEAPAAPTIDNSQDALDAARKQQQQAKGVAATLFSTQTAAPSGAASLMSPGSTQMKQLGLGT